MQKNRSSPRPNQQFSPSTELGNSVPASDSPSRQVNPLELKLMPVKSKALAEAYKYMLEKLAERG
jgi:hypothetical protein